MLLLDGSHSGNEHIQSSLASDQTNEITQLSKRKRSHIHNPLITHLISIVSGSKLLTSEKS